MSVEEARKEAEKKLTNRDIKDGNFGMRSCWNCNPSHEHLKNADHPFVCFECGRWFFKGVDITQNEEESEKK